MAARGPTIVVPFSGTCSDENCQDIFIYLRPDSNGIKVESAIMRGISGSSELRKHIELVYLANLPGDFLVKEGVVRDHYKHRIIFAKLGRKIFTPYMQKEFSRHYGAGFEEVTILGAYDALDYLKISEDELFSLWVPKEDMLLVDGQVIKKVGDIFVVNSDIPAILHKNNNKTDIAVMIFRTDYTSREFYGVIRNMTRLLVEEGILDSGSRFSHVFHYSKGPFEQILDAVGFLYDESGNHLPLENIRFYKYLLGSGFTGDQIKHALTDPIFQFRSGDEVEEDSIFFKTKNMGYRESVRVMDEARAQILLDIYDNAVRKEKI